MAILYHFQIFLSFKWTKLMYIFVIMGTSKELRLFEFLWGKSKISTMRRNSLPDTWIMPKTIVATEDDIDRYRSLTETLQLQDLCVVGQEFDPDQNRLILVCVPRWPVSVCPDCGQVCSQVHDYPKQRTIHDTPIRGCRTVLVFDSRRFDCERCQSSFTEPIRDVVPDCT